MTNKYLKKTYIKKYIFILLSILLINIPLDTFSAQNVDFSKKNKHKNKEIKNNTSSGNTHYYYLSNGQKKSFSRKKDAFILLIRKKNKKRQEIKDSIISQLGVKLDIIEDDKNLKKHIRIKTKKGQNRDLIKSSLYNVDPSIYFISPVLTPIDSEGEVALSKNIIIKINDANNKDALINDLKAYNLIFSRNLPFTDTEFEFTIDDTIKDSEKIFKITRDVTNIPYIIWAEPNFITTHKKLEFIPNDPQFNNQWHLTNTGQNGGAPDSDIDAPEGWDLSMGYGTVIAIVDDSVDVTHEDLNIWTNPGESGLDNNLNDKRTNGIDDDNNGFIDDYQGWNFEIGNNNPSPSNLSDNHGTAVAGVAGAIGNNSIGGSGSAMNAAILPIKMMSANCADTGSAIRYAAKYADVVSNSWTTNGCYNSIDSAIFDAVNGNIPDARRGLKGTPVLFATGNDASGWKKITINNLLTGNSYNVRWLFSKDINKSEGYDTVWIDNITWPNQTVTDFEADSIGSIPNSFTSGGNAVWTVANDGIHARSATGNSVKAGTITDSQTSYLETIVTGGGTETLTFWVWVSAEQNYDTLKFQVYNSGIWDTLSTITSGQYGHNNNVGYPASNPNTIAVGASNDGGLSGIEERSYYSQFGSNLDIIAPSSGGLNGIYTTDVMGANGYSTTNYTSNFGGTSSATPLTAGIVANIISYSPNLTNSQIREILHQGADKIGFYSYTNGRNDHYGYGRINLFKSLDYVRNNFQTIPSITISNSTVNEDDETLVFTLTLSDSSNEDVTVDFSTSNNTATDLTDYSQNDGSLTFTAGETNKYIDININDDNIAEIDESFFINLTNPINATISNRQAYGTIIDNEYVNINPDKELVDFGAISVGVISTRIITIENSVPANVNLIISYISNPLEQLTITEETCTDQPITPNGTCTITIDFTPTVQGIFSDIIYVTSNDPYNNIISIDLQGSVAAKPGVPPTPETPVTPSNSVPTGLTLVYPENTQINILTNTIFIWKKSSDPDGDQITYHLYYCDNENFTGCETNSIALFNNTKIFYGNIIGPFLLVFMLALGLFSRKTEKKSFNILILIFILSIGGNFLTSCSSGGGNDDSGSSASPAAPAESNQPSPNSDESSFSVSNLSSNTTYFWKIIADDGNGANETSGTWSFKTQ